MTSIRTQQYPFDLTRRDQWCLWRLVPGKNGHLTKVPYRPDGRKAASDDPRTWSTFANVSDSVARKPGDYGGVGYFFSPGDETCGIDLDVCLDAHGSPHPWAAEIIGRFRNTYQAFSVSGVGLHVLCRATLPDKGRNFYVPDGPTDIAGKRAQVGVFDRGRFFALTGRVYGEATMDVADHQDTVEWLLDRMEPKQPATPDDASACSSPLADLEILNHARRAKNGPKFSRLWAGDWKAGYGSQSEADLALCCMLAFWCGPDPSRIDALFRQSGLVRDKWVERAAYRERTIESAVSRTSEFYVHRMGKSIPPAKQQLGPSDAERDSLPEIWVGDRQLPAMTQDALASLRAANDPPQLFVRGGQLVMVVRDEQNRHVITGVTESTLRGRMARSGHYLQKNRRGEAVDCVPPIVVVRDVRALLPADWGFPPLDAIVEVPFLRADGTVCDLRGYDPQTHLYHAPAPAVRSAASAEYGEADDINSEAAQWEAFLLALADVFDAESFRVADLIEKLSCCDPGSETSEQLRNALPEHLADAANWALSFFQRRMGKSFSERVGRCFGGSQLHIERAGEDRKSKVQRWRVQKLDTATASKLQPSITSTDRSQECRHDQGRDGKHPAPTFDPCIFDR